MYFDMKIDVSRFNQPSPIPDNYSSKTAQPPPEPLSNVCEKGLG